MNLRPFFQGMIPLFMLGHFTHHALTVLTMSLIPFIRSAFDLDYAQSGLVVSSFTLAYGIGQVPAGWLADRVEARKLMTIGISGVALAAILVGISQTNLMMSISLALMGILAGGYHPTAPPLISASVPPEYLGRALGMHNVGGGSSHFLTPLIAVAIANAWGWRNVYLTMAIPTFIIGIIFYLRLGQLNARLKAGAAKTKKEGTGGRFQPASMPRIVVFLILSTFTAAMIASTVSFIPLLMVDHFHVSKEIASSVLSVIYGAVFWASPLGGYLADRIGSVRVALAVCFIAGPVIILFTVVPYGWGIFTLLALIGTIVFCRMSASETFIVSRTPPGRRSTILGIYFFSGTEGGAVMTPIVGSAIDHFGFSAAFSMIGGAIFIVTVICAFFLRERRGADHIEPSDAEAT